MTEATFEGWVILELMGHRVLAGYVTEHTVAGTPFLRLDIPGVEDRPPVTQFYSGASVYCMTPTTEDIATAASRGRRPQPVNRWELEPPRPRGHDDDDADVVDGEAPF